MTEIADFIAARLAEEEAAARATITDAAGRSANWAVDWSAGTEPGHGERRAKVYRDHPQGQRHVIGTLIPLADAAHIVRQDPAATLARVEALRALVADIQAERHYVDDNDCWYTCPAATEERDGGTSCKGDRGDSCDCNRGGRIERRLRHVAAIWADHEDYDERWKP